MKRGVDFEPIAVKPCSDVTGNIVFLCGFVVNPQAPLWSISPGRKVISRRDKTSNGPLKIKCPSKDKFKYWPYLIKCADDGSDKLKLMHTYHFQITGQPESLAWHGVISCNVHLRVPSTAYTFWCSKVVWYKKKNFLISYVTQIHLLKICHCQCQWHFEVSASCSSHLFLWKFLKSALYFKYNYITY